MQLGESCIPMLSRLYSFKEPELSVLASPPGFHSRGASPAWSQRECKAKFVALGVQTRRDSSDLEARRYTSNNYAPKVTHSHSTRLTFSLPVHMQTQVVSFVEQITKTSVHTEQLINPTLQHHWVFNLLQIASWT